MAEILILPRRRSEKKVCKLQNRLNTHRAGWLVNAKVRFTTEAAAVLVAAEESEVEKEIIQ